MAGAVSRHSDYRGDAAPLSIAYNMNVAGSKEVPSKGKNSSRKKAKTKTKK